MSDWKVNYRLSTVEIAVVSFTFAYMVVSLIAALWLENPEFAFYLVVMSVNADSTIGLLILCIASGMGFGAANEIVEFVATITLPSTNVGGYEITGWDLVANFVGCLLAALLILVFHSNRSPPLHSLQQTLRMTNSH